MVIAMSLEMRNCRRGPRSRYAVLVLLATFARAEADPRTAVETFFTGMATNDWELAASVLMEDAVLYGYRIVAGEVVLNRMTAAEYVERMSGRSDRLLERIWDVEVLSHDRLATVWTPYDFYLNGEFSHCGRNSFSLIHDNDGWRIASVTYSVLTTACPESPLGPPSAN